MLLTFLFPISIFLDNEIKLLAAVLFHILAYIIYHMLLGIGVFHSKLDLNEKNSSLPHFIQYM